MGSRDACAFKRLGPNFLKLNHTKNLKKGRLAACPETSTLTSSAYWRCHCLLQSLIKYQILRDVANPPWLCALCAQYISKCILARGPWGPIFSIRNKLEKGIYWMWIPLKRKHCCWSISNKALYLTCVMFLPLILSSNKIDNSLSICQLQSLWPPQDSRLGLAAENGTELPIG